MAHVCVVNKVDTAPPEGVEAVLDSIRKVNPEAKIVLAASPFLLEENGETVAGKRVLASRTGRRSRTERWRTEPRSSRPRRTAPPSSSIPGPFAVGSIAKTLEEYPHITELLPAMGYGRKQMDELKETIARSTPRSFLIGTPIDLRRVIDFDKPALRVTYRLQELGEPTLADLLPSAG